MLTVAPVNEICLSMTRSSTLRILIRHKRECDGDGDEERNFGGENTEYGDVVSPEDDDERYGEALPTEMGGTEAGDAVGYEDRIGNGEPVDVSETQAIFPGSDKW